MLSLAACTPAPAPMAATTQAPTATQPVQTPTPAPSTTPTVEAGPLGDLTPVSIEQIQNIVWGWSGLVESQPPAQSVTPDPQNYTLLLRADNTFSAQADCNQVAGGYLVEDSNLSVQMGATTLAECGPGSLYTQYIGLLARAAYFGMRAETLVIKLANEIGEMHFEALEAYSGCDAGIEAHTVRLNTQELQEGYQAECVAGSAYDASQPPGPRGLPDHIRVSFGEVEPLETGALDPIIYIIPVAEYEQLWEQAGDSSVSTSIEMLEGLLEMRLEPVPTSGLPVLPYEQVNGVPDLQVQGEYLRISMGEGMRFVTRFVQSPAPVTRDNPPLFYTFQGFSLDRRYLIAFFYPVTTNALPLAEGVSEQEIKQVESDPQAYMKKKSVELNALASSAWEPDLNSLDALIHSLKWGAAAAAPPVITGVEWQWAQLVESDPTAPLIVPYPENYTILFYEDGSLAVQADCNHGGGAYALSGDQISIQIGAMTLAACAPGSLSDQYLALLARVHSYALESGRLTLVAGGGASRMTFSHGETAAGAP
jgi:heat shock protein HslJ